MQDLGEFIAAVDGFLRKQENAATPAAVDWQMVPHRRTQTTETRQNSATGWDGRRRTVVVSIPLLSPTVRFGADGTSTKGRVPPPSSPLP
jgi:hypothetical protein